MDTVWYQNSEREQSNIRAFQLPKITNYRFQRKKKVYQHKWEKDCWNHIHQKIPGYLRRSQQTHWLLHSHPGCPSLLPQLNLNPALFVPVYASDEVSCTHKSLWLLIKCVRRSATRLLTFLAYNHSIQVFIRLDHIYLLNQGEVCYYMKF